MRARSRTLTRTLILTLTLAAVLQSGCAAPFQAAPDGPALKPIPLARIETLAGEQLDLLGVGRGERARALSNLRGALADPEVAAQIRGYGVTAVGALRSGGGGALFGGTSGYGRVAFAGRTPSRTLALDGWSFGAQLGGAEVLGVVLVLGLEHDEQLADTYGMRSTGGAFVTTGYVYTVARADRGGHELHIVGTGTGFGGSAAVGQLRIMYSD